MQEPAGVVRRVLLFYRFSLLAWLASLCLVRFEVSCCVSTSVLLQLASLNPTASGGENVSLGVSGYAPT